MQRCPQVTSNPCWTLQCRASDLDGASANFICVSWMVEEFPQVCVCVCGIPWWSAGKQVASFLFYETPNMLKHVEAYWNILKHVETCWNVETILTDLCGNPMDITISSSYAYKTQCFFHNSAFWNIGMCNLQSVYDRRLPRNQTIFSMRPQRTTTGATSNTTNITKHHETMDSTCCTDIVISRVVPSRFWNLISQLRGT